MHIKFFQLRITTFLSKKIAENVLLFQVIPTLEPEDLINLYYNLFTLPDNKVVLEAILLAFSFWTAAPYEIFHIIYKQINVLEKEMNSESFKLIIDAVDHLLIKLLDCIKNTYKYFFLCINSFRDETIIYIYSQFEKFKLFQKKLDDMKLINDENITRLFDKGFHDLGFRNVCIRIGSQIGIIKLLEKSKIDDCLINLIAEKNQIYKNSVFINQKESINEIDLLELDDYEEEFSNSDE